MLDQDVVTQNRGVAQMLQDRHVNLAVLLQPGMAGKLKKGQQRERGHARAPANGGSVDREPFHFAGVLSSCCFTQIRLGLSSSDFSNAWRASPFLFSLRRLKPSQRYASAFLASNWMALRKSAMASSAPPPRAAGR